MPSSDFQLRIFSSEEFLPPGIPHVTLLYPFWGLPRSERSPGIYSRYMSIGRDYFHLVQPRDADFFVLPFDWRYTTRVVAKTQRDAELARSAVQHLADLAHSVGKSLIIFWIGDTEDEVAISDVLVFRTSLKRGQRRNEFAMPVFFEDLIAQALGEHLPLRPKLQRPSVGFCGFAGFRLMPDVGLKRRVRRVARWIRDGIPSPTVREQAISVLRRHPDIETEFVLGEHGHPREAYKESARETFYRNMIGTDYTLCARGFGNWSIRFYETMASARIPLFVDTECVLPYDFHIDYRDYGVCVDQSNIGQIAEQLLGFHDELDAASFWDLQRACRQLWEARFTPDGFFSTFHEHFERP